MVTIGGRHFYAWEEGGEDEEEEERGRMEENVTVGTKKGVEGGGGGRGGRGGGLLAAPLYCGRFFRMAFTSSATAVRANSNWSCRETVEGEGAKRED